MIDEIEVGSRTLPPSPAPKIKSNSSVKIGCLVAGVGLFLMFAFATVLVLAAVAWSVWNQTASTDPQPSVDPQKISALQKATDEYVNTRPKFQAELWDKARQLTGEDKFIDLGDLIEWIEGNKKAVDNSAGKSLRPFFDELNGIDFRKSDLDETFCEEFSKALRNR